MLPQEVVQAKRDGLRLSAATLRDFVRAIADESVTEGQAAAFAMAVLFRGMEPDERVDYTLALRDSGAVLDWRSLDLGGPVLDKHSTGGIGDKTSLLLVPMVAACGGFVPMISGRGLGHTGGTLDKMDAIPGYCSQPSLDRLRTTVRETGGAIVGATVDLAPADRRLYAIRDVTGTVESLDLITGSILSKKLAAGLDALVLDAKFGSGALLPDRRQSRLLARTMVDVAGRCGLGSVALLTDMNEVLGSHAGNALEVLECIDVLTGRRRDPRLIAVTLALGAEMLCLGRLAATPAEARRKLLAALDSGAAAERFQRMVVALGGPGDLLDRPGTHLAAAAVEREIQVPEAGFVQAMDLRAIGYAIVAMGGGRTRTSASVDPSVGLSEVAGIGERVEPGGRPLCRLHAADASSADRAEAAIRAAVTIGPDRPVPKNPVAARVAEG